MTERSRRSLLRNAVLGGAAAGGAVLLPAGRALAADDAAHHLPAHHDPKHHHPNHLDPAHRHCGCTVPPGPGGPGGPGATQQLQLRVVNNSTQFQDFCVFQRPADSGVPGSLPLAWLTAPAWPTTTVMFRWTQTYNFVWGETGELAPGTTFRAGQVWDADPAVPERQQVQLDYARDAFTFRQGPAVPDPKPGSLYIRELASIPLDTAAAGIGMSGAATFVVPAQPNLTVVFTPHPRYWIAAGTFETGTVLDADQIIDAVAVPFPAGVSAMVATLGFDNRWTVQPDTP